LKGIKILIGNLPKSVIELDLSRNNIKDESIILIADNLLINYLD
jgi:hypothetical protein